MLVESKDYISKARGDLKGKNKKRKKGERQI